MNRLSVVRRYIDYFVPREVMGPVVIIFSLENIVDKLFSMYMPVESEIIGWGAVFAISIIMVAWWGEADEEKDDFEDQIRRDREGGEL